MKNILLHSFAHFIVKIYEKFSLNDGALYDLMMTVDIGLLLWPPSIGLC